VATIHGEHRGMRIMRRLAADFFRGLPGAPKMRQACNKLESLADLEALASGIRRPGDSDPGPPGPGDSPPSPDRAPGSGA
jgi:hypothetical protein